jgi:hypothetical protein
MVWLLDAALQFQPFMFGRGFANEILKPTAEGNPHLIAQPVLWSAHVVLAHPVLWNTIFALTQLVLALGLFWRRSVKIALAGTVCWSLIVWWLGEGLGGVLSGSAAPLMGSPGAVILYALLALLLWPGDNDAGLSLAQTSALRRAAPLAWLLLWGSQAYFALLPANDSPSALHGMLADMADGEPHPIAALDRQLARLVAHHGVGPGLGALFAICALAVLVPPRFAKPLYSLAMILALMTWVGQDFGEILTGQGTDPNSGPLLFLLALAYWPIRPQPAPALAKVARQRPPLLRTAVAIAGAALVAVSSVAAATGITTRRATVKPARLVASSHRMHGPGPVLSEFALGGYGVLFRDPVNRATQPGAISVELHRSGRPVEHAQIVVTYRSLDMKMPGHTISLSSYGHGKYGQSGPSLGMGGRWRITISISPSHGRTVVVSLTDLITR